MKTKTKRRLILELRALIRLRKKAERQINRKLVQAAAYNTILQSLKNELAALCKTHV